ncbi:hypothetical protein STRDD11_02440 [Streptococcus sp. DD11]|nr:hypothetical protein STRDD11_02440 [Streptococcus sp. DD11]
MLIEQLQEKNMNSMIGIKDFQKDVEMVWIYFGLMNVKG